MAAKINIPDAPWSVSPDEIATTLDVTTDRGLAASDIRVRRNEYGRNTLRRAKSRSIWLILIDQFKSIVIGLLTAAAVVSWVVGQSAEALAVAAAITANTIIGFVIELKAVKSMDALRRLGRISARVRRDSDVSEIPASDLVPGDVVLIDSGDVVAADMRLVEANKLQVDESALTGESVPATKQVTAVEEQAALAERATMVFKGTAVTRGSGVGLVTATGHRTEIGRIQSMVQEAEEEITPLEQRLNALARSLIWVTLGFTLLVAVVGVIRGKATTLMIKSTVALAVAAIPEGLPIVATVALAHGMLIMARRNALVNKLASVETLGATDIVGVDKTGTLTENRMTVRCFALFDADIAVESDRETGEAQFHIQDEAVSVQDRESLQEAIRIGLLCSNAELHRSSGERSADNTEIDGHREAVGDPMEAALLRLGEGADMSRPELLDSMPEVREEAFDPETKMMATVHKQDGEYYVAVKGAPEAVLAACTAVQTDSGDTALTDEAREEWRDRNDALAADGIRVLALASRTITNPEEDLYRDLILVGYVGLFDPIRRDVPDAIAACHRAGIDVIMMTGDQAPTAGHIAREAGLTDDDSPRVVLGRDISDTDHLSDEQRRDLQSVRVFARVSPKQKLRLIDLHQRTGHVVAMTGDGVNDAPALKKADIGVAMGQRGSQVAQEAADMILQDDAFPTIVAAVRQGRIIVQNVRKFIVYLLSGNSGEILAVAAASLFALPLPLLPLQILFLNLILDVFPALALGMGTAAPGIMERRPKSTAKAILTRRHWLAIGTYGVIIAGATLAAQLTALHYLDMTGARAVAVSFLALALSRLWHVFNMRSPDSGVLRNEITRNKTVWAAITLCLGLLIASVHVPALADLLQLHPLSSAAWMVALGASLIPLIAGQILKVTRVLKA